MEKAGLLRLQTRFSVIFLGLVLAACARPAPSLPPAYVASGAQTESERAMSCADVDNQLSENKQQVKVLEAEIASNRHDNQTLGYVAAVIMPPLALAAESNSSEKAMLDRLQTERDQLYILKRAKSCVVTAN